MKRWLPHFGIVAGLVIAIYALFFGSSDEDAIRANLTRLEDAVEVKNANTNFVVRFSQLKKEFAEIFIKKVSFQIPELSNHDNDRTELAKLASQAPRAYQQARIDLSGLSVEIDKEGLSAVAYGDAVLDGVKLGGEPARDTREVSIRLDKIDGQWRIVSLTVSERKGQP